LVKKGVKKDLNGSCSEVQLRSAAQSIAALAANPERDASNRLVAFAISRPIILAFSRNSSADIFRKSSSKISKSFMERLIGASRMRGAKEMAKVRMKRILRSIGKEGC